MLGRGIKQRKIAAPSPQRRSSIDEVKSVTITDYSQGALLNKVAAFFEAKMAACPQGLIESKAEPLNLKRGKSDTIHLMRAMAYRQDEQKKANVVQEGMCFWLTVYIWLCSVTQVSEDYFRQLDLILGCANEKILEVEKEVGHRIAELEYPQWSHYHTEGKASYRDIERHLKEVKSVDAKHTVVATNQECLSADFYEAINQLKDQELMLVSSYLPSPHELKRHAVGIWRDGEHFVFVDSNEPKLKYRAGRRYSIADADSKIAIFTQLVNSFFSRFSIAYTGGMHLDLDKVMLPILEPAVILPGFKIEKTKSPKTEPRYLQGTLASMQKRKQGIWASSPKVESSPDLFSPKNSLSSMFTRPRVAPSPQSRGRGNSQTITSPNRQDRSLLYRN